MFAVKSSRIVAVWIAGIELLFSLTPRFSGVRTCQTRLQPFQRFHRHAMSPSERKPLKRLLRSYASFTQLKLGVNERGASFCDFITCKPTTLWFSAAHSIEAAR